MAGLSLRPGTGQGAAVASGRGMPDEPTVVVVEPTRTLVLPGNLAAVAAPRRRGRLGEVVPAGLVHPLVRAWSWLVAADLSGG